MKLWRIATETRTYPADDLSGGGAANNPGRWNDAGVAVLYSAPTIALAVLETAAHIDDAGLPMNRFLIELDVPEDVWDLREELDLSALPVTWCAIPAGSASVKAGSAWLASGRSPILLVPSVVVPEERASLINPAHPQSKRIKARVVRLFDYNRLFRS
jgi:RES domain-containing protein